MPSETNRPKTHKNVLKLSKAHPTSKTPTKKHERHPKQSLKCPKTTYTLQVPALWTARRKSRGYVTETVHLFGAVHQPTSLVYPDGLPAEVRRAAVGDSEHVGVRPLSIAARERSTARAERLQG